MKLEKAKVFGKYVFNYLPDDKFVGQRIALEKYEPYLTKLILRQAQDKKSVVLDIGANIGYYTVLLASSARKVIAIEPDPINFEILKKNIYENKLKNVIAVQAAVGKENKKMRIIKSKTNYGDHRLWEDKTLRPAGTSLDREAVYIFCRRLDDLLKEPSVAKAMEGRGKIDFIKMDVQGFEAEVIEGGKNMIEKNKPTIFFEYWPWGIKNAGSDYKKMMEFLKNIYKKIFWIDEYIQIHFPVSQKFLDKKYSDKKEGDYGNLWVKSEIDLNDRIGQFKSFWIKKLIKRILGRPET